MGSDNGVTYVLRHRISLRTLPRRYTSSGSVVKAIDRAMKHYRGPSFLSFILASIRTERSQKLGHWRPTALDTDAPMSRRDHAVNQKNDR